MKKRRRLAEDEELACASPESQTIVHPQPLVLLALLKPALDLFVRLQLHHVPGANEPGASGQCAAAEVALQLAVVLGHMPTHRAG